MKKNWQNIIIILIGAIVIMLPMLLKEYHKAHDTEYHFSNILSTMEQIKETGSPGIILGKIANDFGYGTRLFYPGLSHVATAYISLGLEFFNINVVGSLKFTHLLILFASGVSMYFLSLKLSKDKRVALVSAFIYMVSPYHLSDIYFRDSLAECFIFPFLPMILHGLFELFDGNKKMFYPLFIIGYLGAMSSHLMMTFYFTLFLIIFFIINFKKLFTKDVFLPLLFSAITILLILSPNLINMLEHKLNGNYAVYLPNFMGGGIYWSALLPSDYFSFTKWNGGNNIKYYLDIITIILLFVTLLSYSKINKDKKNYLFVLIFLILAIFFSTKYIPWNALPGILRLIQFPWRLQTFSAVMLAILAPLCLKRLKNGKVIIPIILIGMVSFTFYTTKVIPDFYLSATENICFNCGMGWNKEYLPVNTLNNISYFDNRNHDILHKDGNSDIIILENKVPKLTFSIETEETATIELPRLFYLGYELKDQDGNKQVIYENNMGFMQTDVESGTYHLEYKGTTLNRVSKVISIVTIFGAVVLYIRKVKYGQN